MNIVLLGPPGAGKGTVAADLKKELGLPHISTGDLFRYHMKEQTSLGIKVKAIIDSGELVPDEVTTEMVKYRLSESDTVNGVILDGYPRTLSQAEDLKSFSEIDIVLNFTISESEIVRRLSGRRLCRKCGKGYHIEFIPPKTKGVCDACNGELYTRDDDKKDAILNRLKVYRNLTEPLIEFYNNLGCLAEIDAQQSPDKVLSDSLEQLNILKN